MTRAERFIQSRNATGLSQRDVSAQTFIACSTIKTLESEDYSDPKYYTVAKLADFYGVELRWLMEEEPKDELGAQVAEIKKALVKLFTPVVAGIFDQLKGLTENLPAEDVAPVKHGEWKWSHGGECSVCGYRNSNFEYNYCPNCGARMEEDNG